MDTINLTADAPWAIAASAFSNPMYLQAPLGSVSNTASTGFNIANSSTVVIGFEGTYTGQTVAHEQTLDPTGETGWFAVEGFPTNGSSGTTSGSSSGVTYAFGSFGVLHRIKVTTLSSGTLEARVLLIGSGASGPTNGTGGGGGGGGGGGVVQGSATTAPPSYSDGTDDNLSLSLNGGLRVQAIDTGGNDIDVATEGTLSDNGTKLDTIITSNAAIETAVTSTDPVSVYPYPATPVNGLISTAMTGTTSTAVSGMGAPGANLYNYITGVIVSNTHATVGTNIELQDGSGGTTFAILPAAPAYGGTAITFSTPLKQPTANTALYAKNSTTGASTFVTVVGFTAA